MKRKYLLAGLGTGALCAAAVTLWLSQTITRLPDVDALKHYRPAAAAEVLDKDGKVLALYYEKKFRVWVPISGLPDVLIHAVVTAEDDTFFEHKGINYKATWDALLHDVKRRRFARGGSTITQQMIKNVLLSREKTVGRKIREFFLAREAEDVLTKRQILEIYLNEVEWGENIFGIEAASRFYFDKHAAELDTAEAALLAGMLPNPRYFNPYTRPDKAKERQEHVLANMFQAKLLSEEEHAAAVRCPLAYRNESSSRFDLSAFSNGNGRPCYQKVLEHILLSWYGEHDLYRQGLKIRTTLDKSLQGQLAAWVEKESDGTQERVLIVKEGEEIRALVCSTNEEAVRSRLDSAVPPYLGYEVFIVSPDSIRRDELLAPTEGEAK